MAGVKSSPAATLLPAGDAAAWSGECQLGETWPISRRRARPWCEVARRWQGRLSGHKRQAAVEDIGDKATTWLSTSFTRLLMRKGIEKKVHSKENYCSKISKSRPAGRKHFKENYCSKISKSRPAGRNCCQTGGVVRSIICLEIFGASCSCPTISPREEVHAGCTM